MGKTGSWLRSFLTGKKERKEKNQKNRSSSELIQDPVPLSTSKERRRWSFGRSSSTAKGKNSNLNSSNVHRFSGIHVDKTGKNTSSVEYAAATRIQSAFRSYLARKALRALRGLVKLQALVRGHLVRKQATAALRCMQALMMAQARARAQRLQMAQDSKSSTPRNFYGKYSRCEAERGAEEDIKIVEVDHGEYKGFSNCTQRDRKENHKLSTKQEHHQTSRNSPAKTPNYDGHFYSPTIRRFSPLNKPHYVELQANDYPFYPNYMANTESSRAKVRSQSAPKTRPPDPSESQPSRRRASMEGRHCPRPARTMQRSASQVGWVAQNYDNPWSVKLDKSSASLKNSECGSTSTTLSRTNQWFKSNQS